MILKITGQCLFINPYITSKQYSTLYLECIIFDGKQFSTERDGFDILHFLLKLNFSYFTTIYKIFLPLISISLICADVSARQSLMWEEAKSTRRKPMCSSDPHALLHSTNDDHWDCAWVAAVRIKWIVHCTTWNAAIYLELCSTFGIVIPL